ncbi:acyl-CoA dehydrogenase family protein [Nonomuraea typhae]|uniref:Acyl-CoA dehydrogenase family protein n=1 Tax=Nonomuraea typhae TaxID=2603600 RepID=A0ABW7YX07_9ACTN
MTSWVSSPSVFEELFLGRVRHDLLTPFPAQDSADRLTGDAQMERLAVLLRERIDPEAVELSGRLPGGAVEALRDAGFLAMTLDPAIGGLGLSQVNAFRLVHLAASWCTAAAFALGVGNGFGSGSYLAVLPPGPLKDMISARVAAGLVSGGADAEPGGTANRARATTAVPVEGGYLISGQKVFIGNAPVADLMDVSATLAGTSRVRLFFVDTRSPGFVVSARHEFMGLRGAAIGAVRLDDVLVPEWALMPEEGDGWRMRPDAPAAEGPDLAGLAVGARHLVIAPVALALARSCLRWSREFVSRRAVDGRGLGSYDEIQRVLAESAADVYAIESVATWGLLGGAGAPELTAAKNLVSRACWRVADRTVSLMGGEGYETSRSKRRRGAVAAPVERAFRDARALRVAGGVDFMLDAWSAQPALVRCYAGADPAADAGAGGVGGVGVGIGGAGVGVGVVEEQARMLAAACAHLVKAHPREELFERQRTVRLLGRIAGELLGMAVVQARSASTSTNPPAVPAASHDAGPAASHGADAAASHGGDPIAGLAVTGARHRLAGLWARLAEDEPSRASIRFDHLITDLMEN